MGGCSSKNAQQPRDVRGPPKDNINERSVVPLGLQSPTNNSTKPGSSNDNTLKNQLGGGGEIQNQDMGSSYSAQRQQPSSQGQDGCQVSPAPQLSLKLEESQRRRLSVSTVATTGIQFPIAHSKSAKGIAAVKEAGSVQNSYQNDKPADSSNLNDISSGYVVTRTAITTFPDPALELVNEETGTIRDVSVENLCNLFYKSDHTFLLFGAPSYDVQRAFDVGESKPLAEISS